MVWTLKHVNGVRSEYMPGLSEYMSAWCISPLVVGLLLVGLRNIYIYISISTCLHDMHALHDQVLYMVCRPFGPNQLRGH